MGVMNSTQADLLAVNRREQGIPSENQRVPLAISLTLSLYPASLANSLPQLFCNLFLEPSSVRALVPLTWNHHKTAESATSERNENYFQINLTSPIHAI